MKTEPADIKFFRPKISTTTSLKVPNYYTLALNDEFQNFAFDEVRAPLQRGKWRCQVLGASEIQPVDLEIGTGNGVHFQHHTLKYPQRFLVGIELKYKPLIQTIRGMLRSGAVNGRVCRFHAFNLDQLFAEQEVNDIYIHFPDPWTSPRKPQNRILNARMLDILWQLQRPGSKVDFKTDSLEMFLWSLQQVRQSQYQIEFETQDLHQSILASENVLTQFERIFLRQKMKINFVRLRKN